MKLSDKDKVSIVAGICLFGLVVVLKNVLLASTVFSFTYKVIVEIFSFLF